MKRKLTSEERTLTEKGIRNMQKELSGYQDELKIIQATIEYLNMKRKYEDLIRPYNDRRRDKELKGNISMINAKIEEVSKTIQIDQTKLKDGLEIKENKHTG